MKRKVLFVLILTMAFISAWGGNGYENSANPWFISYDEDEGWENISKEDYNKRDYAPEQYEKLNFIPLSKIK